MSKRPKSREETPKEGSDSARRYRTATICGRDAQSASLFRFFPMQIAQGGGAIPAVESLNFVNKDMALTGFPRCCRIASVGDDLHFAIS